MLQLRLQSHVTSRSLKLSSIRSLHIRPAPPKARHPRVKCNSVLKELSEFDKQLAQREEQRKLASFQAIADDYSTVEEVQSALRKGGLESSNLIVAIDFTKSNTWTGQDSFGGKSLHAISKGSMNPYQQAIASISETLAAFDDDQLIPCYGFGDVKTDSNRVFSFKSDDRPCKGLEDVQAAYAKIAAAVNLSGPTSFAPAIRQAIKLVSDSGNQYHILLLLADGQVSDDQEKDTIDAVVEAVDYPLSIVMVGVGDGPWDMMNKFDDELPERRFDNFQFVNFTQIASRYRLDPERLKAQFALNALMEVPEQYKTIRDLRLLSSKQTKKFQCAQPVNPPVNTV